MGNTYSLAGENLVSIIVPLYLIFVVLLGILACQIYYFYKIYRFIIKLDKQIQKICNHLETLTRIMIQCNSRKERESSETQWGDQADVGGGSIGIQTDSHKHPAALGDNDADEQHGYEADNETGSPSRENESGSLQQQQQQSPMNKCAFTPQSLMNNKHPGFITSTPKRKQYGHHEMTVPNSTNRQLMPIRSPEHTFPKTLDLGELPATCSFSSTNAGAGLFDFKISPSYHFSGKMSRECQFSRSLYHDDLQLDRSKKVVGTKYQTIEDSDKTYRP